VPLLVGEVPVTAGGMSCLEHWSISELLGPSGSVLVPLEREEPDDICRGGLG
jgi:hypothetical protein